MSTTKKTTTAKPAQPATVKSDEPATAKPAEPVETAVAASQETLEQVVKVSSEAATKTVEKAVEVTQEQVAVAAKAGNDALKAYEDAVAYGKDNFDAVLKANDVLSKGLQEINKELFAGVQASFEDSASVTRKFFACTSVQEVVDLQNTHIQATYSKAVDQSKKIAEMSVKMTEDTAEPLSKRMNVTVEKIAKPLAA